MSVPNSDERATPDCASASTPVFMPTLNPSCSLWRSPKEVPKVSWALWVLKFKALGERTVCWGSCVTDTVVLTVLAALAPAE